MKADVTTVVNRLTTELAMDPFAAGTWVGRLGNQFGDEGLGVAEAALSLKAAGMHEREVLPAVEEIAAGPLGAEAARGVAKLADKIKGYGPMEIQEALTVAREASQELGGVGQASFLMDEAWIRGRQLSRESRLVESTANAFWGAQLAWARQLAPTHGVDGARQIIRTAIEHGGVIARPAEFGQQVRAVEEVVRSAAGSTLGRLHDELGMPWDEAWKQQHRVVLELDPAGLVASAAKLREVSGLGPDRSLSAALGGATAEQVKALMPELTRVGIETNVGSWAAGLTSRLGEAKAHDVVRVATEIRTASDYVSASSALIQAEHLVRRLGTESASQTLAERVEMLKSHGVSARSAVIWTRPDEWAQTAGGTLGRMDSLRELLRRESTAGFRHGSVRVDKYTAEHTTKLLEEIRGLRIFMGGDWSRLEAAGLGVEPLVRADRRLGDLEGVVDGWAKGFAASGGSGRVRLDGWNDTLTVRSDVMEAIKDAEREFIKFLAEPGLVG